MEEVFVAIVLVGIPIALIFGFVCWRYGWMLEDKPDNVPAYLYQRSPGCFTFFLIIAGLMTLVIGGLAMLY